ncbi:hypothetical protein [Ruegeria discodermiae]|uniref:hypothetical protein n=1 Tax=Ruegeria discodermiae TaxID=3064389 RepID=UPI0027406E24|nr:hypothetical protein [Ruegeria sp. 2205SS24-7]
MLDPGNQPNRKPLEGEIPSATSAFGNELPILILEEVAKGHLVARGTEGFEGL